MTSTNWRSTYPVRYDCPFSLRTDELISDANWEPSIGVREYLADLKNEELSESYRNWVVDILPILPALIEWNSINPSCVELIKEEGEKSFYRRTLLQVQYKWGTKNRAGSEEHEAMKEYEKLLEISEIATNLVLWMRQARNSPRFKYARFFKALIRSLPKEAGMRLLRARLQREPRFAGRELPESVVESRYANLV